MNELGKFRASAPNRFAIKLISNGKIATRHCLDIAGVASSILATPTMKSPAGFVTGGAFLLARFSGG